MFTLIHRIFLTTLAVTFLFHVSDAKGYKKMYSGRGQQCNSYQSPCYQPNYYYEPQCWQSQPSCYQGCNSQYGQSQCGCQPDVSYPCQSMSSKPKKTCWSPQSMCFQNRQMVNPGSCCTSQPSYCYQQVSCRMPTSSQCCQSPCNNDGCRPCSSGISDCCLGYNSGCGSGCSSGCSPGCSSGCGSGCGVGCGSGCGVGCGSGSGVGCGSGCNSGCGMGCGSGCNSGYNYQAGDYCGKTRSDCGLANSCNNVGCETPNEYVLIPMLVPKKSLGANFMGNCVVDSGCGKCSSPCY